MDGCGCGREAMSAVECVKPAYVGGVKVGPIGQVHGDGSRGWLGVLYVGTCGVAKVMSTTGISNHGAVIGHWKGWVCCTIVMMTCGMGWCLGSVCIWQMFRIGGVGCLRWWEWTK